MSVLYFLVIIGILVAAAFLAAFIWAVRSGQFDDSYTPSVRMLFDDMPTSEEGPSPGEAQQKTIKKTDDIK
ncbi:cbb3-type cytochrome oxidase assembly protein CcoS [Gaoshiqia sp. Z1-71]|uniref:cbb3-type cytochrome oxidase assembly protein CcoS n=1 Tax=Gaoshiqia hydrogeniformans TaxID=3290090 RepID=UPI003BF816DF